MLRLDLTTEPRWLDLGHGVRLRVAPLTTALMVAAREGSTAANGASRLNGLRIGWSSGPYGVVVATAQTTNDLTGPSSKFKDTVVGGNAGFGPVKLTLAGRCFVGEA